MKHPVPFSAADTEEAITVEVNLSFFFSGIKSRRGQAAVIYCRNLDWDCLLRVRRRTPPGQDDDVEAGLAGTTTNNNVAINSPTSNPSSALALPNGNSGNEATTRMTEDITEVEDDEDDGENVDDGTANPNNWWIW